jgi:hypothetical protein
MFGSDQGDWPRVIEPATCWQVRAALWKYCHSAVGEAGLRGLAAPVWKYCQRVSREGPMPRGTVPAR